MRTVEAHLLEDKMDEAVTHYINSHHPNESVHIDANGLPMSVQDDGTGRVTIMHQQTYTTQMCRQVSVTEQGEGPWAEELLEGPIAAIVAHLQNSRHPPAAVHHKVSQVRSDVDTSVILDGTMRFNGQSLEQQADPIVVQLPPMQTLPPLQDMKRCSDTDWFTDKNKKVQGDDSMLQDSDSQILELASSSPAQHKQQSRKSLPHKKRISRKLKRNNGNSTPQQELVVINCNSAGPGPEQEQILPDSYVPGPHHMTHEVRPVLICQICGDYYGEEQLKFYHHLRQHYEPHTIIIENPVQDLPTDKISTNCIVDNVATLPDSIVELSLENTVPKTLYQPIDKHILYTSSEKTLTYNKMQYSMASSALEKEPGAPEPDKALYCALDKLDLYSCTKCSKTFRKQKHCEAHMRDAHHAKCEDMGEFSEPEDLMAGIQVCVGGEYEPPPHLLPTLTVDNGHVTQDHATWTYGRAPGGHGAGAGPCGGYCGVCTREPDTPYKLLKEEVLQRIFDSEVSDNANFADSMISDHDVGEQDHNHDHGHGHEQGNNEHSHGHNEHSHGHNEHSLGHNEHSQEHNEHNHRHNIHSHEHSNRHNDHNIHNEHSIPNDHLRHSEHSQNSQDHNDHDQHNEMDHDHSEHNHEHDNGHEHSDSGHDPSQEHNDHSQDQQDHSETSQENYTLLKQQYPDAKRKRFSCTKCDRVFAHRNSLLYHVLSHGGKQHMCRDCGKGFYTHGALKIHRRLHSNVRPFKCETCGREFRQWSDLKYHSISIHSDKKHFKCEYCGKEFARKYSLNLHVRIHTGEKNYKCDYCAKTFSCSSYRLTHMRIHTGDRPFKCEECGKQFRSAFDLRRHSHIHDRVRNRFVEHKPKDKKTKMTDTKEQKLEKTGQKLETNDQKFNLQTEQKNVEPSPKKIKQIAVASTTRQGVLMKKQSKSKKTPKKGAPNVTIQNRQGPYKLNDQYTNNVVVYDCGAEYAKLKNKYTERHQTMYKDEQIPHRELAILRPIGHKPVSLDEKVPYRAENTDGKMQVFTHVEKLKEYNSTIVTNTQGLADLRHLERDVTREVRGEVAGEGNETAFLERLTAMYNISAV